MVKTTEDFLRQHAEQQPNKTAIIDANGSYTYGELWAAVQAKAATLQANTQAAAPSSPRPYVIRASQTKEFIADYLAVHLAGGVAVPLEHDVPDVVFANVCSVVAAAPLPPDAYDILFTTGTTGQQKGVIVSATANMANTENLIEAQGYSSPLTFLICGPLNHIGSLSKLHPSLVCGATIHVLEGMKDLNAFFAAIDASPYKVASFLVPTTIRLLLRLALNDLTQRANRFDFIETGAAPIAQDDMRRLCDTLPQTRLFNTYASTETGIIATHNFANGDCIEGCLGCPMRHSSVELSSDGLLVCRGKTLMSGYVGDQQATAAILYDNALHTQDRGYIDPLGRIRLQGRDGDVLNIGGYKIAPTEVEHAAMAINGVADCICIAAPHPVFYQTLKLLVVTNNSSLTFKEIATALQAKLERHKVPLLYQFVDHIERTYNGKLNRKAYANKQQDK